MAIFLYFSGWRVSCWERKSLWFCQKCENGGKCARVPAGPGETVGKGVSPAGNHQQAAAGPPLAWIHTGFPLDGLAPQMQPMPRLSFRWLC